MNFTNAKKKYKGDEKKFLERVRQMLGMSETQFNSKEMANDVRRLLAYYKEA